MPPLPRRPTNATYRRLHMTPMPGSIVQAIHPRPPVAPLDETCSTVSPASIEAGRRSIVSEAAHGG
jgi:hypothetical protein